MNHRTLLPIALIALLAGGCDGTTAVTDPDATPPDMGCAPGFVEGPGGCVDVDECGADAPPCDPLTECINLSGGFTCGSCPQPYVGSGATGCVLDCGRDEHFDGVDGCAPEGQCAAGFRVDEAGDCVACPGGRCRLGCPADDGFEPDDTPETARAPGDGEQIVCAGDADVFRVALDGGCRLIVTIDPDADGLAVELRGPDGEAVPFEEARGAARVIEAEVAAGPVLVVVTGDGVVYRLSARVDGHDGGDGACVAVGTCSPGFELDGEDCVPESGCPPGEHDGGDGGCVPVGECAAGYHDGGEGRCVPLGVCADGFHDGGEGGCVPVGECAPGYHDGGLGGCVPDDRCDAGFRLDGEGVCVEVAACPEGEHDGGDGVCVDEGTCSVGYRDDGRGACAPIGADCAAGFHDGGDATCQPLGLCGSGFVLALDDTCRPLTMCEVGRDDGTGRCAGLCETGFHPGGGQPFDCVPIGDCARGFVDRGDGTCVPPGGCLAAYEADDAGRCFAPLDCPADDAHEPSDAEAPAALPVGVWLDGVLCPGDVDVYLFDAPPCAARVRLRHAVADGDLELVATAGDVVERAATPTDDERLIVEGEGPWRVEVRGEGGRYALRVDLDGHDGGDGSCQLRGACAEGYTLDDDQACTYCAAGYQAGGGGACTPEGTCAAGFHDGNGATPGTPCVAEGRCLPGYRDGGDGVCRPDDTCAVDHADRGDGICAPLDAPCVGGRVRMGRACACPAGLEDGGDGACVPPGTCSPGHQSDGLGACTPLGICADGFHYTPWSTCRPTRAICGAGRFDDGAGRCAVACAAGFRRGGGGRCVAAPTCDPGFRDNGAGTCAAQCAVDHRLVDGRCLPTLECPGDGVEALDDAPILALGGVGEGVVCAPGAAVWRVELPEDCGAVARLQFDAGPDAAARLDLDLALLDADGGVLAETATLADEERLVLPPGPADVRFIRVQGHPPGAAGEVVYRLDLIRDGGRCPGACPDPLRPDGAGGCVGLGAPCAPGYRDDGAGACAPLDACAPGFHDDGIRDCVPFDLCAEGAVYEPSGWCRPAAACGGQRDDGTGRCADACAPGFHDGGGTTCHAPPVCARGYADNGAGACVRRLPGLCAPGHAPNGDDLCLSAMCPEALDPGDTPAAAQPVELDGITRVDGVICADDAGDAYRVDAEPGCLLEAHLRFDHAEGDLALAFLDAQGAALAPRVDTGDDDEVGAAVANGPVAVVVEPVGDAIARYRLDLRLSCP